MSSSFPYLARTTLKYKSPHATDLSFAKDQTIRVTGPSPDDEDWLVGELLDGSKSGGFPKDFIVPLEEQDEPGAQTAAAAQAEQGTTSEESAPAEPIKKEVEPAPVPVTAPPPPQTEPSEPSEPSNPPQPPGPVPIPQAADSTSASAATGSDETAEPQSPSKMTLKDRLAFFAAAQNKAAPPPPVKPKPATGGMTWSQRQKLRQEQEEKERAEREARGEDTAPSAPTTAPAPEPSVASASVSSSEEKKEGTGMSAADAASSIGAGGSLKERMAALRAGGAFGAPKEEKPAPPKPSGKVWTRPPAPPEPEPEEAEVDDEDAQTRTQASTGEDTAALGEEQNDEEDQTEEEKEKARRAAIAARMAKLGARGPMGMAAAAPPKPARKPTQEQATTASVEPVEKQPEPVPAGEEGSRVSQEESEPLPQATSDQPSAPSETDSSPSVKPTSPPASVPIAAIPRRAAPPRRRGGGAPAKTSSGPAATDQSSELEKRVEQVGQDGTIEPPPQVMVADEEKPLAKTPEQLALEKIQEETGRGEHGAEGAAAAGIALAPVKPTTPSPGEDPEPAPVVVAIGGADSHDRGIGQVDERDAGDIVTTSEHVPAQEVEEGLEEGGAEKDDIFDEAAAGRLAVASPSPDNHPKLQPAEIVPLQAPGPSGPTTATGDDEEAPPPPPHRPGMADLPKDEVELRHERDLSGEHVGESGEGAPLPPPRAPRGGSDKPLGPRPLPSPGKESTIPPPPVGSALVPPRDEEEEEREAAGEGDEEDDEDGVPPPPPIRDANRPPVPAVLLSSTRLGTDQVPPPPPRQQREAGTEDTSPAVLGDAPGEAEDEDDAPPPPPPQRKPTMPPPIRTGSVASANVPTSPHAATPVSPNVARSAALSPTSPIAPAPLGTESHDNEDEEKARRAGIAARMAKLGGIKFGAPPPPVKKMSTTGSEVPTSPINEKQNVQVETPISPIEDRSVTTESREEPSREEPQEATAPGDVPEEEESPEAEAARRRATLARLRAGGALGFGMFNHGPASTEQPEEQRDFPEEPTEEEAPPVPSGRPSAVPPAASAGTEENDDIPPPPPAGRPPVPSSRPSLPPPPKDEEEDEEEDEGEAPPPPPPSRPARQSTSEAPSSPIRSLSGVRPPIPASPSRTTYSPSHSADMHMTEEPASIITSEDAGLEEAPQPPPNRPSQAGYAPPIQTQSPSFSEPRRSISNTSRFSKTSSGPTGSPVTRQPSLGQAPAAAPPRSVSGDAPLPPTPDQPQSRSSTGLSPAVGHGQGTGRPGYDALVSASQESGSRLARAAKAMFDQGKKAYYGDGSPAGFVLVAMESAHIPRPQSGWGQLVYEQEAGSVLKRYDEPRPGDIAAFYDAKLKGRKGLHGYEQHIGSVEDPLVGVVVDFEVKNKHKVKVLQVERGVPGEVSYRLDDLKSGRAMIYRPGV